MILNTARLFVREIHKARDSYASKHGLAMKADGSGRSYCVFDAGPCGWNDCGALGAPCHWGGSWQSLGETLVPIPDFDALRADDSFLADLGNGVWLMDDHRWALKVWETERMHDHYTLVHADYHWDCCYNFHERPAEEAHLVRASPEQVSKLVAEGKWIGYDSFIAPAIKRGLVRTVHFFCLQGNAGEEALDEDFLRSCGAQQVVHDAVEEMAKIPIDGPMIFDLCLDLFNRSDKWAEGDLWADQEINKFMYVVGPLVTKAELVTISMSFNYSGTPEQTRHLTKRVLPQVLARRDSA